MNSFEESPKLPQIVLKFSGLDYYPSELVMNGLELVEQALHELEEDALRKVLVEYDLQDYLYAIRAEMDKMRRRHLQLYDANRGCLELWGYAGAGAIWVIQLTIGESIKDAYKKTEIHRKLSALFSSDLEKFAKQLSININNALHVAKRNSVLVIALSRVDFNVEVRKNSHGEDSVFISLSAKKSFESIPSYILPPR